MKTNKKTLKALSFVGMVAAFLLFLPFASRAGFGLSPPYVQNEYLTRGSHYEQQIYLVRGDPVEDLKVDLIIKVPGADSWLSVDKGLAFVMPKGETNVPVIVSVDVPPDAVFGQYKGTIEVKTSSPMELEGGSVGISLGGQIDVNLNVSKEVLFNFKIRGVKVSDLEEGHPWLWWKVPGIIKFEIQLENLGNVKSSPSRVAFDIYNSSGEQLLEKVEALEIEKADPFTIKWVTAKLPTGLKAGSYWARYRIYKNEEVSSEGKVHLSILPYDTLSGASRGAWASFSNLQPKDQRQVILLLALAVVALAAIACGIYLLVRYIIRQRREQHKWYRKLFKRVKKMFKR